MINTKEITEITKRFTIVKSRGADDFKYASFYCEHSKKEMCIYGRLKRNNHRCLYMRITEN